MTHDENSEDTRLLRLDRIARHRLFIDMELADPDDTMAPGNIRIAGNEMVRPAHLRHPITRNPAGAYQKPIA